MYRQRFPAIPEGQVSCPSYGVTGNHEEAIALQKRNIKALAAADMTVHTGRSLVAARVNQAISVAVQRVVAFNTSSSTARPCPRVGWQRTPRH